MTTKKTAADYYKKGKAILSKNIIAAILVVFIFTAILGFFTLRPEMFYLCGIILGITVIALITDNKFLNSMAMAAVPLYIIVLPLQPIAIHVIIFAFTVFVMVYHVRNASPGMILLASVFYFFYGLSFWKYVEAGGDSSFYQALFTPLPMIAFFSLAFMIALVVRKVSKKKSWW